MCSIRQDWQKLRSELKLQQQESEAAAQSASSESETNQIKAAAADSEDDNASTPAEDRMESKEGKEEEEGEDLGTTYDIAPVATGSSSSGNSRTHAYYRSPAGK